MGVEGPHCQPTSFDLSIRHRQVKAVPGRKTDLKYGKWLADLLAPEFVRRGWPWKRAYAEAPLPPAGVLPRGRGYPRVLYP